MGLMKIVSKANGKIGDGISKAAALSPQQLNEVAEKRDDYLLEMPDPNDMVAQATTEKLIAANSIEVFNAYLPQIAELYTPLYKYDFDSDYNVRYFNITKWVTDNKENSLEKLVNVYAVLSDENCNIALIFNRTVQLTEVYLAVTNTQNANNNSDADTFVKRLQEAVKGNFPGTEFGDKCGSGIPPFLKNEKPYSVASASNIPTEKSEKFISQTIEKLLDGIVPGKTKEEYTLILLASPINDVEQRKLRLSQIYSGLKPYSAWQTNFTVTELNTQGSSATVGVNVGASAGIQNGQNSSATTSNSVANNRSTTNTDSTGSGTADTDSDTSSDTISDASAHTDNQSTSDMTSDSTAHTDNQSNTDSTSTNTSHTDSSNETLSEGGNIDAGIDLGVTSKLGLRLGGGVNWGSSSGRGTSDTVGSGTSQSVTSGTADTATQTTAQTIMKGAADTLTRSTARTLANTVAKTTSSQVGHAVARTLGKTVTNTLSRTAGVFSSTSFGANFGMNFARSSNVSASIGKNEGIVQSFENYNIQHALQLLEEQMKRLEQSTALGMWDFAAYVLSEDRNVANNVAHTYLSLTQGESSYMSSSAVNLWRGDKPSTDVYAKTICSYLRELRHPVFGLNPFIVNTNEGRDNLLRRTSAEQPAESANIQGKSVEMLANAIAEMRTYGEGFIIADQAPKLMDMSVIRNTNTKIIMRLPDRDDRELVGRAANLDDDQINELAKLPCGVGAVYQNEWIQPVLCKIDRFESETDGFSFSSGNNDDILRKNADISKSLLKCIMDNELFQIGDKEDLRELKSIIIHSSLDSVVKADFLDYLSAEKEKGFDRLQRLVYDFLKAEDAIQTAVKFDDIHEWVDAVISKLDPSISDFSKKQTDLTIALILHEKTIRDPSYRDIYHSFTEVYKNGGGVF